MGTPAPPCHPLSDTEVMFVADSPRPMMEDSSKGSRVHVVTIADIVQNPLSRTNSDVLSLDDVSIKEPCVKTIADVGVLQNPLSRVPSRRSASDDTRTVSSATSTPRLLLLERTCSQNNQMLVLGEVASQKQASEMRKPREVKVGITILQLNGIEDVRQLFSLTLYMQLQWEELPGDKDDFEPFMEWRNAVSYEERSVKVTKVQIDDKVLVTKRSTLAASFAEPLELEHFPFDYQKLHVTIVSDSTRNLRFVPLREPCGQVADNGVWMPHWKLAEDLQGVTVAIDFTATDASQSASGQQYAQIVIRLFAERVSTSYIYTISASGLMSLLGLTQFGVPVKDLANRLSVNFALLLTVVGLKF